MISVYKQRVGVSILASILTLGIYQIYWAYRLVKNTRAIKKDESGCTGEVLALIFIPFYPLYWWVTRGKQNSDIFAENGYSPSGDKTIYLILGIFGLSIVSMAIMQSDFNSLPSSFAKPINKQVETRMLAEGGVCIAISLAMAVMNLKIPIGLSFGGFGGSIDLVMIPLIIFAVRWGCGWGIWAGFAFGTLKYVVANGVALNWVSILFDYSVAYAAVGLAGLLRRRYELLPLAALIGCVGRFVIHFISGVTVYAEYMPEEFMGVSHMTPPLYSLLYNGTYMVPNTILAIAVCALLIVPTKKVFGKR